ncbi:chloride channel protein [Pedomonas mirosovicensis]|uniref:chloride channel protein n=1 Tax=Pedomonas mirosovicensis TaxID=2908641 RepID=UPI002168174D|nr:chloride channel protein [Pedomonas mirosovicensis]MCH8685954.1 chloride channel protein [Pedomonas mirosovicensis]
MDMTGQVDGWRRRAATLIGAILVGLVALAFAWLADATQEKFGGLWNDMPVVAGLISPLLFALLAWITLRWVPDARGSGIPQVIAVARHPENSRMQALVSLRTAFAKFWLTVAALLGGASVGREGPTVQVGAALMMTVHRWLRVPATPGVLIAGGAAGVAAAFNTPLAGVAFAIEELASAYEQRLAVLVMGAVMVSGLVSLGIAGDYIYLGAMHERLTFSAAIYGAMVAGVAGGIIGGLFTRSMLYMAAPRSAWIARLRSRPVLFAAGCGLVVALTGLATNGMTWGTGYEAARTMVEGEGAPFWYAIAKWIASFATAISGIPGGIFAPSLSVGAGVGNMLAGLFPSQPAGAIVLLGMIGYFTGVVRAPLTAVIIVMEATNARGLILPLFATALIADWVSAMICPTRLYHGLAQPFLQLAKPVHERG